MISPILNNPSVRLWIFCFSCNSETFNFTSIKLITRVKTHFSSSTFIVYHSWTFSRPNSHTWQTNPCSKGAESRRICPLRERQNCRGTSTSPRSSLNDEEQCSSPDRMREADTLRPCFRHGDRARTENPSSHPHSTLSLANRPRFQYTRPHAAV